jgi:hypothetical protein
MVAMSISSPLSCKSRGQLQIWEDTRHKVDRQTDKSQSCTLYRFTYLLIETLVLHGRVLVSVALPTIMRLLNATEHRTWEGLNHRFTNSSIHSRILLQSDFNQDSGIMSCMDLRLPGRDRFPAGWRASRRKSSSGRHTSRFSAVVQAQRKHTSTRWRSRPSGGPSAGAHNGFASRWT